MPVYKDMCNSHGSGCVELLVFREADISDPKKKSQKQDKFF